MEKGQDKKNERIAFLVSVGLHASLFLTFFFLISWRAPYPPAPEYGVVLNYGLDNQGGGDIQPETPVGNSQAEDNPDSYRDELKADENNQQENPIKDTPQKEEVKEDKTDATLSDEESPVTVKTEKKKIEDKPKEKVDKVEPKKETKPVKEESLVVKKEAIYSPNSGT